MGNLWHVQNKLNLGVNTIHLTLAQDTRHLQVQCMYPNHTQAINILSGNKAGVGLNKHWPVKQKRALGEIQAGLGIMEQAEFTFNEE